MDRDKVRVFDNNWRDYDHWFEKNQSIFQSELKILKKVLPAGTGLEIGVGTGRFASCLSARFGLDPSLNMLKLAKKRNVEAVQGVGEDLPFKNESFHFILIVVTICFVDDPCRVFKEAARTLKKNGILILGMLDKESQWGKFYEQRAPRSKFYKVARFFSPKEILQLFENTGFKFQEAFQTLLQFPPDIKHEEEPRKGFGQGGFVVLKAKKF